MHLALWKQREESQSTCVPLSTRLIAPTHEQSRQNARLSASGGSVNNVDTWEKLDVEVDPEVPDVGVRFVLLLAKPRERRLLESEEGGVELGTDRFVLVVGVENLGLRIRKGAGQCEKI